MQMASRNRNVQRLFIGFGGIAVVGLLFAFFIVPRVVDPYVAHKAHIPTCRSNRKQLLRIEHVYRDNHPHHQYATKVIDLDGVANAAGQNLNWYRCPEAGTYRIALDGKKIVIYCTIQDHSPVSEPDNETGEDHNAAANPMIDSVVGGISYFTGRLYTSTSE